MSPIMQNILTAIGASGIMTLIFTSVVTRILNKQYAIADKKDRLRDDNQLLMMSKMDVQSEMIHLMANKLHEAKIINGDLEELDKKYRKLDEQYRENIRTLALEVLKK